MRLLLACTLVRGQSGLSPAARRATRIVAGLPDAALLFDVVAGNHDRDFFMETANLWLGAGARGDAISLVTRPRLLARAFLVSLFTMPTTHTCDLAIVGGGLAAGVEVPDAERAHLNPDVSLRPRGVIEKCTFCHHRTKDGQDPACVAVCPTRCMTFGDLDDPASKASELLRTRRWHTLLPEAGTGPRVFYVT